MGRRVAVAQNLLSLAQDGNDGIERKMEVGDTDPSVLRDNHCLIVSREAQLIDEQRKLRQTAVKLSLVLRDAGGCPLIPDATQLPEFPDPVTVDADGECQDIQLALSQRPEPAI